MNFLFQTRFNLFLFFFSIQFVLISSNKILIRTRRQTPLEPTKNGTIPFGITSFIRFGSVKIGTPRWF